MAGCLRAAAGSLATYAAELADARHAVALLRAEDDRLRVAAGAGALGGGRPDARPGGGPGPARRRPRPPRPGRPAHGGRDPRPRWTRSHREAAAVPAGPAGRGRPGSPPRCPSSRPPGAPSGPGSGEARRTRTGPGRRVVGAAHLRRAAPAAGRPSRPGRQSRRGPGRCAGVANEVLLRRDLRLLRERRDLAGSVAPVAGRPPWALGSALAVADALAAARAGRDPVTGRPVAASLLVYRPAAFGGQGRVAVAVGDLDRADHVAVLVPGLGSTVPGSVRGLTADAARLVDRARTDSPGEVTAVVAWTAYDAPSLLQVASEASAGAGGRLLASDLRGLARCRR